MKKVVLVSDGACLGNPGPGGWATILRFGAHEKMLSGMEPSTTNNRMEIQGVLSGLTALKEPCEVHAIVDSRYVMDAFEKGWIRNWKANGWKTAAKKEVKNQDLWELLDAAAKVHTVRWQWVKGHNGHPDNERVDQEASSQAYKARSLNGPVA